MKKLFCLITALLLCLSAAAHAEGVLVPGWDQLPAGQLAEARDAINARLDQLSREAAADQSMTFSGSGIGIIPAFDLDSGVWAFHIELAEPSKGTITISADGKADDDYTMSAYRHYSKAVYYDSDVQIDYIAMEFDTGWVLTVEPVPDAADGSVSGTGTALSGFFLPPTAQMAEITITAHGDGAYDIDLMRANPYSLVPSYDEWICSGSLKDGETITKTVLITPDKKYAGYTWIINCADGFAWSISCK